MGKGTPLTSTMVGRAVYELLEYGDAVSLRDLRLVLQSRTRVDLTSQKPLIKQMAENAFATLTSGMWEPIPRNVLRTRSRNHPGDGFAWFSMTLVTRVLDCADSRNQDELWQTTHVCDPETRHETCEAKVQIRMARGKMPSVLPRLQDELWQTTHVCDPETRHETCEAKVQIRMARGKMPSVLPRLFADKHVVNDRQPMTASCMLLGGGDAQLCPRCFDPGGP
eukprot:s732_g8.t1